MFRVQIIKDNGQPTIGTAWNTFPEAEAKAEKTIEQLKALNATGIEVVISDQNGTVRFYKVL
jgi:hypothetical protein